MATLIKTKSGKKVVLLNPAERSKRYARNCQKAESKTVRPSRGQKRRFVWAY